jgi:hypothetical protein
VGVGRRRSQGAQRNSLVKLAVNELYQDLDALKLVVLRKLNCTLRMLEVERFIRIRSPIAQAFQKKLSANVLKQYSHGLRGKLGGTKTSLVATIRRARGKADFGYPE